MRILVSNDDGIFSPGLLSLARVAAQFGQVRVVAPDVEQSAMGHAITISRPLQYRQTQLAGFEAYRVNGTPADCVALGAYHWGAVDLVLSGINIGSNLGHEIWHSGTVAAAKQGALLGIPAMAFSTPVNGGEPNFVALEPWVQRVLEAVLHQGQRFLINVNLPNAENTRGLLWTKQSVRHYEGFVVPGQDPMGRQHYWFAAQPQHDPEEGTDRWAVQNGLVSLTPLQLDLTDQACLSQTLSCLEKA